MTTINETVSEHINDKSEAAAVIAALQEREDKIRDDLTLIAAQLGTYPEFVAEAFAQVGLGTPPTPEVRKMLNNQFAARMQWLIEQQAQGGGE